MVDGFPPTSALLEVFERQIPLPVGLDATSFYNCVPCYADEITAPFDSVAATVDLEASVVQPLREAEALFAGQAHVTRLTSSLDAVEMTVDPTFALNPDMPGDVSRFHDAVLVHACGGEHDVYHAPRVLTVLPESWSAELPSLAAMSQSGQTEYEYLSSLTTYAALRIEQTSATGPPVVLRDETAWLEGELASLVLPYSPDPGGVSASGAEGGCGCAHGTASGLPLVVGLLGLLTRRRRA